MLYYSLYMKYIEKGAGILPLLLFWHYKHRRSAADFYNVFFTFGGVFAVLKHFRDFIHTVDV